ncbi:MAG: hypothetical protein ABSH52_16590 [Terriglobia bacterium]|jgi:hypothetical protein
MDERLDQFLGLSTALTGFDGLELRGTGVAGEYLRALDDSLPGGIVDELLAAYTKLPEGAEREAAFSKNILDDPKLGPVVQRLTMLWYCGTWTQLPDAWRAAYGISPHDTSRVVSPEAYLAGLQWVAAGAHPPGSAQQGFGSWAVDPKGAASDQ